MKYSWEIPWYTIWPTASSAATQSIIQQLFGSSFLSPASTAISSIASNVVSSLRPGKHSASISSSLSSNRPTTTSRLMRAAFKEAFAYLAAPFFMPIAVGRAMVQPPGLNDQNQMIKRFARFLIKEFVLKGTEAEKEFQVSKAFFLYFISCYYHHYSHYFLFA